MANAYNADDYNFSRTIGSGMSGSLATAGSNTITFTSSPAGLIAGNYVYISGGTGGAEAAKITASTTALAGGGSGTITITTGSSHTGTWQMSSATRGMQEAIETAGGAPVSVYVSPSSLTVYATTLVQYLRRRNLRKWRRVPVGVGIEFANDDSRYRFTRECVPS